MQRVYKQAINPTTGAVDLSVVPKVKDVYEAIGATWNPAAFGGNGGWVGSRFGKGLGDYGLEVHHTSVTKWAQVLLGRDLTQAELDNMPALLIRKVNHSGKKGSGAFHAILSDLMPYNSTVNKQEILDNLQEAYTRFGQPEVWSVAREWLTNMGVQ
jgi:hypothetical protein